MASPRRQSTPQPRIRPVKPQRIVAAKSGGSAKATVILKGRVRIPRPKITASRRIVPARSGGTPPPIRFEQGVRRGPTKNNHSRLVVANSGGSPRATTIRQGRTWLPRPRITASRRIVPAPFVAPVNLTSTNLRGIGRVATRVSGRSRRVVPATLASAPSSVVRGNRWAAIRPQKPRFYVGVASPAPATRAMRGSRWTSVKPGRPSRLVAPVIPPPLQDYEEARVVGPSISAEVRTR